MPLADYRHAAGRHSSEGGDPSRWEDGLNPNHIPLIYPLKTNVASTMSHITSYTLHRHVPCMFCWPTSIENVCN